MQGNRNTGRKELLGKGSCERRLISRCRGMQDCFRLHPETYGDELEDNGPDGDGPDEAEVAGAVDSAVQGVAEDVPMSAVPDAAPSILSSTAAPKAPTEGPTVSQPQVTNSPSAPPNANVPPTHSIDGDEAAKTDRAKRATAQVREEHNDTGEGGDDLVPKEFHDTRKMNEDK